MKAISLKRTSGILLPLLLHAFLSCGVPDRTVQPPPSDIGPLPAPGVTGVPVVRVLVTEPTGRIEVSASRAEVAALGAGGSSLGRFTVSGAVSVRCDGDGLVLRHRGGPPWQAPGFVIDPGRGSVFEVEGVPYRGRLSVLRSGDGLVGVNLLEIDDYLMGVLPSEIGHLGENGREAYRAQAIASRSYALSKLEEKKNEPWDLRATIMDQVYNGVSGENRRASEAVADTRGLVGSWKGTTIRAYYSSCCGGHTADIRVGWPWKAAWPYLFGVRDAPRGERASFCSGSGHFRWKVRWSGSKLARILGRTLPDEIGSRVAPFNVLRDLRVERYSPSGRAEALIVVTDTGTYRVEGDRIRWVLRPESAGGSILRSTLFKMRAERAGGMVRSVELVGGGNGHGIGMCQTGAIAMASLGYSAEEILRHYYPGISIDRIYE